MILLPCVNSLSSLQGHEVKSHLVHKHSWCFGFNVVLCCWGLHIYLFPRRKSQIADHNSLYIQYVYKVSGFMNIVGDWIMEDSNKFCLKLFPNYMITVLIHAAKKFFIVELEGSVLSLVAKHSVSAPPIPKSSILHSSNPVLSPYQE